MGRGGTASLWLLLLLVLVVSPWRQVAAGNGTAVGGGRGGRPRVPAVLVFGDSIVDTGNNNAVLTLTRADFRPYGQDLNGGVPTGRFSNGRIPSDLLASRLGLKDLVPAYLGTDLTDDDLLTGVSFASGGTGYDPLTSTLVAVLPMQEELNMFAEYKEKLAGVVGDEAAAGIVAESLFLVCAGTDDIANNYYLAPVRPLQYDISSYVDFLVQQACDFMKVKCFLSFPLTTSSNPIVRATESVHRFAFPGSAVTANAERVVAGLLQQLYLQGARRIAILGLPPIGCVPLQRTLAGGLARDCDPVRNRAAQMYNSRLKDAITQLQEELRCQRIGYVDIYDVLHDMITDPCKYGFNVSTRGCCGTGDFEVSLLCNQLTAATCPDDRKYVFWDSFHPTERAYEIIVDYLFPRYVEKLL
ncbi:GDSL esterase/lipase EXL3 [Dichanthelium oligosanthes]|uniref:GDSL esterase/lipase EXL3 n=1 Tax=Dichanthelium oligosanthes TaxID=888268 RepID=A0A1E5VD30_9POAL|nr:GDSL esterase/lipase EXL3 [Dichanthelium oligosanthes]